MKTAHLFPIGFLLATLAISWGCTETSPAQSAGNFTPRIAEIAGVQIGYSTEKDLERSWGEGLTITGGHPNSGRLWRVRDTDWVIATDGFLYSDRGLVIDALQIESQQDELNSKTAPFAKLDKKAFAWLGEISPGMTKLQVITTLNKQTLKFKEEGEDLLVEADGFSKITSQANANIRRWQARLLFKAGKLSILYLNAGPT